jgi:perosamine synthetase
MTSGSELALNGGPKTKTTPFGTGKRFGTEELQQLREALEQNTLFYWSGRKVKQFCADFAQMYDVPHCVATSSGTASLHVAVAALGIGAGDEVITSPITDMGSLIGILFQGAIPVFADVDPHTYNMDPTSIEARITPRTRALMVVHLAGNPCDMDAIMAIAEKYNLKVIEDCAQSYLSIYKGCPAGTIGDVGCFSLNDFKHISAGDGGMCITKDPEIARQLAYYADKHYHRDGSGRDPEWLAANYRMSELVGAVAIAQLKKVRGICERRNKLGDMLTGLISDLPGIQPHRITPGGKSSYWFYMLRVNEQELGAARSEFVKAVRAEGIPCSEGYIARPVYCYDVLTKGQVFKNTRFPLDVPDVPPYGPGMCPTAEEVLATACRLSINEFYTDQDIKEMAAAIRKVAVYYASRSK